MTVLETGGSLAFTGLTKLLTLKLDLEGPTMIKIMEFERDLRDFGWSLGSSNNTWTPSTTHTRHSKHSSKATKHRSHIEGESTWHTSLGTHLLFPVL
jgi:hypothetical protein